MPAAEARTQRRIVPTQPLGLGQRLAVQRPLATTPDHIDGELTGGMVMSLMIDSGIAVAVTSNIAHANTSSLALRVRDAFAGQTR